jgi:hypothetical protein
MDIHNPAHPSPLGEWMHPSASSMPGVWIHEIFVRDQVAYVAFWLGGLQILDVSDPSHLVRLGQFVPPDVITHSVWVDRRRIAYLTELRAQEPYSVLRLVDCNDATDLTPLSSTPLESLHFLGTEDSAPGIVITTRHSFGIDVLDVTDPYMPVVLDSYDVSDDFLGYWGVSVANDYLYAANSDKGLYVFHLRWAARGDVNGDHAFDITDIVGLVGMVVRQQPLPALSPMIADWNCDSSLDLLDLVAAIDFIFRNTVTRCDR